MEKKLYRFSHWKFSVYSSFIIICCCCCCRLEFIHSILNNNNNRNKKTMNDKRCFRFDLKLFFFSHCMKKKLFTFHCQSHWRLNYHFLSLSPFAVVVVSVIVIEIDEIESMNPGVWKWIIFFPILCTWIPFMSNINVCVCALVFVDVLKAWIEMAIYRE